MKAGKDGQIEGGKERVKEERRYEGSVTKMVRFKEEVRMEEQWKAMVRRKGGGQKGSRKQGPKVESGERNRHPDGVRETEEERQKEKGRWRDVGRTSESGICHFSSKKREIR